MCKRNCSGNLYIVCCMQHNINVHLVIVIEILLFLKISHEFLSFSCSSAVCPVDGVVFHRSQVNH